MIKVKGKIAVPKFNKRYFNAALQKVLLDGQKEAIAEWVKDVVEQTPVFTGTARATLVPLGRQVGYFFSVIPRPDSGWKKVFKYNGLEYPLGIDYAKRYQEKTITQTFAPNEYRYTFIFEMDLLYAVWNNRQPAPAWLHLANPTPWVGLERGNRSFQTYVISNIFIPE